jgi:hypothetical protein
MAKKTEIVKFFCPDFADVSFDIKPTVVNVINGKRIIDHGKSVKFQNNVLETDDKEVIEYLRSHEWFGLKVLEGTYKSVKYKDEYGNERVKFEPTDETGESEV